MRDPVERMVKFIRSQKQQAAAEHARAAWSRRLPALLPCVEEVVEAFRCGLEEPAAATLVSVAVDLRSDLRPLVVLFQPRDEQVESGEVGILPLHPGAGGPEVGASAVFRCGDDGIVYGFRYPFHGVTRDVRPERFIDLGPPAGVLAHRLGDAVADFLEWASVGEGCGRRRLRFWSPAAEDDLPRTIRLGVVTAGRPAA
jgi:hypothetical protein